MNDIFNNALDSFKNGQLEKSKNICIEILKKNPKDFNTLHLLGIIYFQKENYTSSNKIFEKAIEVDFNNEDIHNYNAISLVKLKNFASAINSWDNAIKVKPKFAEAYNNKGGCLIEIKQFQNALKSLESAIKIKPEFAEAHNNKGIALIKIKEYENAKKSFEEALKNKPNFPEPYINMGNLLKDHLYRPKDAIKFYEKGIELNCNSKNALSALIFTKLSLCEWKKHNADLEDLKKKIVNKENFSNAFYMLAFYDSLELQNQNLEMYIKDRFPNKKNFEPIIDKYSNKKIRIAYYSADFRNHPVCYQLINLIELHDKSKFEIIGMSFEKKNNDEMYSRIVKAFDEFHHLELKSDKNIVELSRKLKIDIAVDLMGFTKNNRFEVFIERCAPIQINFLGYSGTTGANCIDYIVGDKNLISKNNQKQYSEKIINLPGSFMINDSNKKISDKNFSKKELFLPEKSFVFYCFNNFYKITPNVFDIWMRILKKNKKSVLWLSEGNSTVVKNLKKEAESRSVEQNRIIFSKKMPLLSDHLARHNLADLFLDTFPYNAHSTCSDALWSGLPIITKAGTSFSGRVAASMLHAIGLPELITKTENEYEELALYLSCNKDKIRKIKNKLKTNRLKNPLFDTNAYVKNIEKAYIKIHKRNIKNLLPENIEV